MESPTATTVIKGAKDESARGKLNILIAGAGIGGLTAAIALRQQGHEIHVYEQSRLLHEVGAAVHIAPNSNGLLKRLGLNLRDAGSVELLGSTQWEANGELRDTAELVIQNRKMWQHSWEHVHRGHLHEALLSQAIKEGIDLNTASRVESVDPATAAMTLTNGKKIQGDVVIGADGVHSMTRKAVPGGDLTPFDSGKSAYRFLIPTEKLVSDPKFARYTKYKGHFMIWYDNDRRMIMYPCDGGKLLNFVAIFPSAESEANTPNPHEWHETGNKAKLYKLYESWGDTVESMIDNCDEDTLKLWTLLDMDTMPHYVEQKFAAMGDAAHPFLPHQGQGAAQAIEDAIALAAVLPAGTLPEDVPERLQLYERQRFGRAQEIQDLTRFSGQDLSEIKAQGKKADIWQFMYYNVGHDEWHSSTHALDEFLWKKNHMKMRSPVGFGPAPGPMQPLGLYPNSLELDQIREETSETSSTISIRFKSSRTYLQNLLPPGFSFASPATLCDATIQHNELDGLAWLAGGGHRFISLQIHGIQYTKKDGEKVTGAFIPVILDDLADSIISGRDDVGMPKVHSDIDVKSDPDRTTVTLSWRGTEFGTINLSNLTNTSVTEPARRTDIPPETGLFAYRHVPAVGTPGKVDAEYPIFVPNTAPSTFGSEEPVVRTTEQASLSFEEKDHRALPTLHHVAKFLAGLPIYEVLGAKHVVRTGVEDFRGARRME